MTVKHMYVTLFILLGVCCSSKKTSTDIAPKSQINPVKKTELISKGFTPGIIQESPKNEDCLFTILVSVQNKQPYFLDPINLDEAYKKNDLAVFFKYKALRMMNRCQRANPVEIEEMQTN